MYNNMLLGDNVEGQKLYSRLLEEGVINEKSDWLCGEYYVYKQSKTAYRLCDLGDGMLVRAMTKYRRYGFAVPQAMKDEYARRNADRLLK